MIIVSGEYIRDVKYAVEVRVRVCSIITRENEDNREPLTKLRVPSVREIHCFALNVRKTIRLTVKRALNVMFLFRSSLLQILLQTFYVTIKNLACFIEGVDGNRI